MAGDLAQSLAGGDRDKANPLSATVD